MAPTRITARAYAKINLSLDVGPLRADGYHALASVMQTISLADDIEVELRPGGEVTLTCDAADIPNDERNTAVRAALSALRRWGPSAGAHIALTKRIPAQAGLGGGSSDAAVVLRAVARLLGRCPSDGEMTAAAAEIGSDVPFFVRGGTALVAGKGELVTPQGAAPRFPIVVAKPRAGVSTADAYRALDGCDESRPYPPGPRDRRRATPDVSEALAAADTERLLQAMGNHFELVIPQLVPPVASLMVAMRAAGARAVHLCGSGSAVFGVAESDEHARMMAVELATACPFVVVCEPVDAATATALEEKSVTPNSTQDERIPAIVMAGGTASAAFVAATGVPHRAMLSVPDPEWTGSPAPDLTMLDVAVRALTRSQRIAEVHVVTDLDAPKETNRIADHGGFVGNLFAGIEACADAQRACVCTADMPYLTTASVDRFVDAAAAIQADLVYPIVRAETCASAYPGMRRTCLPTREGRFTGGNIVLICPAALLAVRRHIEAAHANRKSPLRLAMMLGIGATVGVAISMATGVGLIGVPSLERAVSRLIGATARAVVSDDAAIATDVDRPEDVSAIRAAT